MRALGLLAVCALVGTLVMTGSSLHADATRNAVKVTPYCGLALPQGDLPGTIEFHVRIRSQAQTRMLNGALDERQADFVYTVLCTQHSGEPSWNCAGTRLDLGRLEQHQPLRLLDVGPMENLQVVSANRSVGVITWGNHTFTLDQHKGEVTHRYTGSHSEERGIAACGDGQNAGRWPAVGMLQP